MKKWRCTVCNYIHTGETPPEVCPVCGADRTKFVEISEEEAKEYEQKKKVWVRPAVSEREQQEPSVQKTPSGQSGKRSGFRNFVDQQLIVHHAHPVVVHVPNGVLPIVVLFMFLSAILGWQTLAQSAFAFTIMVVISMPVVFYTGFNEWVRKYNGARSSLFMIKIAAAVVVATTSLLIVLWYFINPDVIYSGAAKRGSFLFLNLIMLGATGVAGYIGGKLVFKD